MEELNKKMLEFAGFKEANIKKHYYWEIGGERCAKWTEPNTDYHIKPPDFTNSELGIAYCFKWLVPKLHAYTIAGGMCAGNGVTVWLKPRGKFAKVADKPTALCLCLAIEKLIDGEKDV